MLTAYYTREILLSSLGSPEDTSYLFVATEFQHGFIQAQVLAQWLVPANASNSNLSPDTLKGNPAATEQFWSTREQQPLCQGKDASGLCRMHTPRVSCRRYWIRHLIQGREWPERFGG
ncbi:hypothetical protein VTI74DRAFT_9083 [Chaetomium olivicolor]